MNISRLFIISIFISFGWYFYQINDQQNYYVLFAIVACIVSLIYQVVTLYRKRAYFGFTRNLFQPGELRYPLIIALRWAFLLVCFLASREVVVTTQTTEAAYTIELSIITALFVLVGLSSIVIKKQIDLVFNACLLITIIGLGSELIKARHSPNLTESVVLAAPFKKPFFVISGGVSRLHSNAKNKERRSRSYLTHLIVTSEQFMQQPRSQWTDYPNTFGEQVYAPASGIVRALNNSQTDAAFDEIQIKGGPGNFLVIEIDNNQYMLLAHLKQDSISVQVGDSIIEGQAIAESGKSGSTSEAALAICVFNSLDIFDLNTRSYPIFFRGVDTIPATQRKSPHFAKRNQHFAPIESAASAEPSP